MAGAITAAVIGGAAVLGSAAMSSKAAKSAARTQADSADRAAALQQPFLDNGYIANNRLMELLGLSGDAGAPGYGTAAKNFTMEDFYRNEDPGYGFRMREGLKAIDRSAAARGGLISGNAMRAAQTYGQDMASQEYGNAYNRYMTNRAGQLNPLQSLSGQGMSTAGTIGNIGMSGANALAAGQIGSANAINNAVSQGVSAYQNYNMMNRLFPQTTQQGLINQYGQNNVFTPTGGGSIGSFNPIQDPAQ